MNILLAGPKKMLPSFIKIIHLLSEERGLVKKTSTTSTQSLEIPHHQIQRNHSIAILDIWRKAYKNVIIIKFIYIYIFVGGGWLGNFRKFEHRKCDRKLCGKWGPPNIPKWGQPPPPIAIISVTRFLLSIYVIP